MAGLGQADRDLFLADMGVTDEECGLQVRSVMICFPYTEELFSCSLDDASHSSTESPFLSVYPDLNQNNPLSQLSISLTP